MKKLVSTKITCRMCPAPRRGDHVHVLFPVRFALGTRQLVAPAEELFEVRRRFEWFGALAAPPTCRSRRPSATRSASYPLCVLDGRNGLGLRPERLAGLWPFYSTASFIYARITIVQTRLC